MTAIRDKQKSQPLGTANVPCKQQFRKYDGQEYENFRGTLTLDGKNIAMTIQVDKKTGGIVTISKDKQGNEIPTVWVKCAVFPSSGGNSYGSRR